jgi:hypothetical protein
MTPWRKKLVLALALAVMPLQGVAATLSVLSCYDHAQAHAMHAQDTHDDPEHSMHHDGHPDESGATGHSAHHLCCNVTASAPPFMNPAAVPSDFRVRAFVPDSLPDLFVPEQPQRPPLA